VYLHLLTIDYGIFLEETCSFSNFRRAIRIQSNSVSTSKLRTGLFCPLGRKMLFNFFIPFNKKLRSEISSYLVRFQISFDKLCHDKLPDISSRMFGHFLIRLKNSRRINLCACVRCLRWYDILKYGDLQGCRLQGKLGSIFTKIDRNDLKIFIAFKCCYKAVSYSGN
jgi:hypothetical protein